MEHLLATLMQVEGSDKAPALFTILFDVLSRIISRMEEEGTIHGVKVYFLISSDLKVLQQGEEATA